MLKTRAVLTVAVLTIACVALAGCEAPAARQESPATLFCTAYPELLGTNPIYCRDTILAAKARGIDYGQLINACLGRDKPAMHQLFRLASDDGIEGDAAREGHVCFVGLILTRTGDAFFAECLAGETGATQESVRQGLLISAGYAQGKEEQVVDALKRNYPKVFPETWRPK